MMEQNAEESSSVAGLFVPWWVIGVGAACLQRFPELASGPRALGQGSVSHIDLLSVCRSYCRSLSARVGAPRATSGSAHYVLSPF